MFLFINFSTDNTIVISPRRITVKTSKIVLSKFLILRICDFIKYIIFINDYKNKISFASNDNNIIDVFFWFFEY